jgi:hypothetical protein
MTCRSGTGRPCSLVLLIFCLFFWFLSRYRFGIRNGFFVHGWFGFLTSGFLVAVHITSALMDINALVTEACAAAFAPAAAT